jgi:1-phosphatidylinositol-3-phosphate 5-kinase
MENLYNGMSSDKITYDLKGSDIRRFNKKGTGTLLDTNFRIDRNGEPLPINIEYYSNYLSIYIFIYNFYNV